MLIVNKLSTYVAFREVKKMVSPFVVVPLTDEGVWNGKCAIIEEVEWLNQGGE